MSRMVRIHSPHPEAIRTWTQKDAICEAILPLVHRYPGSSVTDDITLIAASLPPDELVEAIETVIQSFHVFYLD